MLLPRINTLRFFLAFIYILLPYFTISAHGLAYSTAVRVDGSAISNALVLIHIDIIDNANSPSPIYSESHEVRSDSLGRVNIIIGEGNTSSGSWSNIDWSKQNYARLTSTVDNDRHIPLDVISLFGSPKSSATAVSDSLVSTSADGSTWKLNITDNGDLFWTKINGNETNYDYDKSKWPADLYLVGDITNNWDPASSMKFTKIGEGVFSINYYLTKGCIIKFIKVQSWGGGIDWSGTSGNVGSISPLKEYGDTPAFNGNSGNYTITVDFSNFSLKITTL